MLASSPSVQTPTEGQQTGTVATPAIDAELPPSLTGPAPALWAGFAAFVVVFVVVLMLIIRGRVIRPAARNAATPADFFEPAGETAEITFDDETPGGEPVRQEPAPGNAAPVADQPEAEQEAQVSPEKADGKKVEDKPRRSTFAGLFSRKPKPRPEEARTETGDAAAALEAPEPENNTYDMLAGEAEDAPLAEEEFRFSELHEGEAAPSVPAQLRTMDDDVEARRRAAEERELRRLEAKEEAEEQARSRERTAAAALAAFPRTTSQSSGSRPMQGQPAAPAPDPVQLEAMQRALEAAFADKIDALTLDIDERLGALEGRLESRISAAPAADKSDFDSVSEAHFAELANLIGEQLETLREASTTSIDALSRRLDKLDAAPEGVATLAKNVADLNRTLGGNAGATTAGRLQLADILANALPPGRYALARKLSTAKTVDALVYVSEKAAPVAVDARFPVEAFDDYERSRLDKSRDDAAETEFRRLMLRRIVDIAEKQIAPDETADCAFMFIPSERILTTLYANFSDIVQESYRARIWMVSPASLTASLYTISTLTGSPEELIEEREEEDVDTAEAAEETDALNGAQAQTDPPQPPDAPAPEKDDAPETETTPHTASYIDESRVFAAATEQPQPNETADSDDAPNFPLR